MRETVILDANKKSSEDLSSILKSKDYPHTVTNTLVSLEKSLSSGRYITAILDIDSVPVDNREIRDLTLKYTEVRFLCTSEARFHPELKDAICYHIYACIRKPIDPDELFYWLRSAEEDA